MNLAAVLFTCASAAPVPLLAMGAAFGGVFPWLALGYLTVFTLILDELIAHVDGPQEFPAAAWLSNGLAIAHFLLLPLVLAALPGLAWAQSIPLFAATTLFFGQVSNSNAHELIHSTARLPRALGKWIYISHLYGHHSSAHPLIHHRFVGTEEDPNTARAGESFYSFVKRAWPGAFRAGYRAEAERIKRGSQPLRHPYAEYLTGAVLFLVFAFVLSGWTGLLTYLALAIFAQGQLLLSDYVQHYGLRRQPAADGRLPPVGVEHAWNAPHPVSSLMMLHAPRHSAHHMQPGLAFHELTLPGPTIGPTLPHSLPMMSVIALMPPLWRRVMDPHLAYWQTTPLSHVPPPKAFGNETPIERASGGGFAPTHAP